MLDEGVVKGCPNRSGFCSNPLVVSFHVHQTHLSIPVLSEHQPPLENWLQLNYNFNRFMLNDIQVARYLFTLITLPSYYAPTIPRHTQLPLPYSQLMQPSTNSIYSQPQYPPSHTYTEPPSTYHLPYPQYPPPISG